MITWKRVFVVVALLFAAIQLVPFGHDHTNPPVIQAPTWSSPEVATLARRACFDCHSNQTHWPWYSNVAPMSWLVVRDVKEGRKHLNFSEFQRPQKKARAAAEEVHGDEMPPWFYLQLHPEARITDAEKRTLADGFFATFGAKESSDEAEGSEERESSH
jgi:hypothetical protein